MTLQNNYTLAEVLRTARLERKLTLSDVELSTKIRSSYISALEKGDYSKLPADIYIRGMLRLYSHFLGLDYQEILRLYRRDGHIGNVEVEEKKYFLTFRNLFNSFALTSRLVWFFVLSIIALGILVYIYFSYQSLKTPPNLTLLLPENNQEYEISKIKVKGLTDLNTEVRINSDKVLIDEKGNFEVDYDLKEGKNLILVQAISNKNRQINEIKREVYFKKVNKILKVSIEGLKDSSLTVFGDDKELFLGPIKAGEAKNFEAKNKIIVKTSDGSAILYAVNDSEKKVFNNISGPFEREFLKDNYK